MLGVELQQLQDQGSSWHKEILKWLLYQRSLSLRTAVDTPWSWILDPKRPQRQPRDL